MSGYNNFAFILFTIGALCSFAETVRATGPSAAPTQSSAPEGLSASDWAGIRSAYDAGRHAAYAVGGGYQSRNVGQQWRTRFDGRGFAITPDCGGWSWGLELIGYGRAGDERAVTGVTPALRRSGQRVEYQWDEALTEWYINDTRGLEHGYTVHRRSQEPAGDTPTAHLQLTLRVRGDLCPQLSDGGRHVTFVNDIGAAVVNYSGLTVMDADGAAVPAWFESARDGLRLFVDDRAARYPLTIDPVAQQAYLKASNTGASDFFGHSVAVSGDTVVVGAIQENSAATGVNGNQADNSATAAGAAYVFVRDVNGVWSQQAYLKASNTGAFDYFGKSVAASGDTVVVGAPREDSSATGVDGNQADNSASNAGAAYVFVRSGTTWSQQAYLKASNSAAGDFFGGEVNALIDSLGVAVSGDTVVVGAWQEDSNAFGVNGNQADDSAAASGAAYVFVRSGTTWSQQAYLKASNTGANDGFGWSVAVSADTLLVGAYQEASNATGVNGNETDDSAGTSGAAYVFVRNSGVWSQQAYLKASNTGAGDQFGWSVGASGDTVVVGAYLEDSNATGVDGNQADNSATNSGAAYVFVRNAGVWSQQAYLKASNTDGDDRFGWLVGASGDTVVVGAYFEDSNAMGVDGNQADNSATDSGAAYVFVRNAGVWSQQAYLKASNTEAGDYFGFAVAASGDTVVVGAWRERSNATGVDGNQADNSALFAGAAYVFIVCPTLGNMNCDCAVDIGDADPFVQVLIDPDGYAAAYPNCPLVNGDLNGDFEVNGDDIQPFVDVVLN